MILVVDVMCVNPPYAVYGLNRPDALMASSWNLYRLHRSSQIVYYHQPSYPITGPYIHFAFPPEHAPFRLTCASCRDFFQNSYSKNKKFLRKLILSSILSAVFGPKLGMRAMVQCRFSWGYVAIFYYYHYYYVIIDSSFGCWLIFFFSANPSLLHSFRRLLSYIAFHIHQVLCCCDPKRLERILVTKFSYPELYRWRTGTGCCFS